MKEMKPEHYSTEYMQHMIDEWEKAKQKERIAIESDEPEKALLLEDWTNNEQLQRLKEDIEQLQREENAGKK